MEILAQKIEQGYRLGYDEAVSLATASDTESLCRLAERLRGHFTGRDFDTCSIMNARSGRCSENCKWCSQSKFFRTNIDVYPLVGRTEALEQARHNAKKGVRRFSLVTSGRTLSDTEVRRCCDIYTTIGDQVGISLCASLGLLTKTQLVRLRESGVRRYHCNLESAPSYFPQVCTTHTIAEKIQTIRWAQEAGLEICSGGIIGMGETENQRIELAVALQALRVQSIPLNVLNPIPGTALEGTPPLSDDHVLRSAALFRIINPDAHIRLAGGRNVVKHLEPALLHAGISASIVGDLLTTTGSDIDTDKAMFIREGFSL